MELQLDKISFDNFINNRMMDSTLIVLIIICFYLLPAIPAILFYLISPKAIANEARTVAAYGPISVKFGGAAAFYLAFFFLLNHTPLMDELKNLVGRPNVSMKGNIVFIPPEDLKEEARNDLFNRAFNSLKHASVNFEPTTEVVPLDLQLKDEYAIGSYEIIIPRSWVWQLQEGSHTRMQVDPRRTEHLSSIPIEIDRAYLPDQHKMTEREIQLRDIRFRLFPISRNTVEKQINLSRKETGNLYRSLKGDKSDDPYATLEVKTLDDDGR